MMRTIRLILPLVFLAVGTSCLKTVSSGNTLNPAGLAFVNMAIAAPSFSVTVDETTVGTELTFPYASYDSIGPEGALKYTTVFAGIHSGAFLDSTILDTAAGNVLVSGQTQFSNNLKYSIYLFDTLTGTGLQAVQILDSYDSIPSSLALMRFLNFCPSINAIDLWVKSDTGNVLLLSNQPYAGSGNISSSSLSTYSLTVLPTVYTFYFLASGTPNVIDSLTINVLPNKAYSMFVTGLIDSTGQKAFTAGYINMN